MPPVPAPKTSTKQYPVKLDEEGVWRFKPDEADAQGDTALAAMSSKTAAKQWLPAVEAAATDAGAAIDETVRGDVIAAAVRDLVNDGTVQAIEGAVFNVVKAIADAVNDGTESEGEDEDDEEDQDDKDDKDDEDDEDKTPQRKKKIARKRERTPEETQPMSPEDKATPSTPDPDESQKVDKDGDDSKIMSPCKKPKQEQQEQRGSDLAVMM